MLFGSGLGDYRLYPNAPLTLKTEISFPPRMYTIFLDSYSKTLWLGFDKQGKSLYGIDIDKWRSPTSIRLKINKLFLFMKGVETIEKITIKGLLAINSDLVSYSFEISQSGEFIGIARWNHQTPISYQICLISTKTGSFKIYTFDNQIDHLHIFRSSTLLCSDENEWLMRFSKSSVNNFHVYHRLIFDDDNKTGTFRYLTNSCCKKFSVQGRDELFIDHKLIEFSVKNGFFTRMHVYDFITNEWTQTSTYTEPGIIPSKCSYFVFGRDMNNLFAVSKESNRNIPVLKYHIFTKTWRKTKMNINLNQPSFRNIDLRFNFNRLNLLLIRPRIRYSKDFKHRVVFRYKHSVDGTNNPHDEDLNPFMDFNGMCFIKNVCSILSLKDLCLLQLANNVEHFSRYNMLMNTYSYLPQSLIREYFEERSTTKAKVLDKTHQCCNIC